MKRLLLAFVFCIPHAMAAQPAKPVSLTLPPGFTATVVADGLINARHMAIRGNDIYVSTNTSRTNPRPHAIHAIRLGPDHKPVQVTTFGDVYGGTGIRVHDGALYAASGTTVWRYQLDANLVPSEPPQAIVVGMRDQTNRNRILEFDESGSLYVNLSGDGNNACAVGGSRGTVGMKPCPDLVDRAGIWRFSATKPGQKFAQGEQFATGIRNMTAFRWSPRHKALYGILHDRDSGSEVWPQYFTLAQELAVGDALYRIGRGTDFGWPYSYYDGVRKQRLVAPEYGGDGKTLAPAKAIPVLSMVVEPTRAAPVDMVFYNATQFPPAWRGGLFISRHGGLGPARPGGYEGYDIVYLPMDAEGRPGKVMPFASGFAGPSPDDRTIARASHRPNGLGVAPDGALFVVDSKNGTLWRIAYTGNGTRR
jgi:glucose/arabinose dehydrogenase